MRSPPCKLGLAQGKPEPTKPQGSRLRPERASFSFVGGAHSSLPQPASKSAPRNTGPTLVLENQNNEVREFGVVLAPKVTHYLRPWHISPRVGEAVHISWFTISSNTALLLKGSPSSHMIHVQVSRVRSRRDWI